MARPSRTLGEYAGRSNASYIFFFKYSQIIILSYVEITRSSRDPDPDQKPLGHSTYGTSLQPFMCPYFKRCPALHYSVIGADIGVLPSKS